MDLSNKSLALLLLAAVVISLGGTIVSLNKLDEYRGERDYLGTTGRATDTSSGTTQLNINNLVGCNVDTSVDFGTGAAGDFNLTTDRDNTVNGFNNCTNGAAANCRGMQINNTGNTDLNITMNATDNVTTFLGGTPDPNDFQYQMRNGTYDGSQQGCVNNTGASGWAGSFINVPVTSSDVLCYNLTSGDTNDIITIEYNVSVKSSTPPGLKQNTINILCGEL